jgi:hypothetical protein
MAQQPLTVFHAYVNTRNGHFSFTGNAIAGTPANGMRRSPMERLM